MGQFLFWTLSSKLNINPWPSSPQSPRSCWPSHSPRSPRVCWKISDAPRDQDNLLKLLSALSVIAAPSASTLPKNVHKFWRVPALGAAIAESALSNFPRVRCVFVDLGTVLLKRLRVATTWVFICENPFMIWWLFLALVYLTQDLNNILEKFISEHIFTKLLNHK